MANDSSSDSTTSHAVVGNEPKDESKRGREQKRQGVLVEKSSSKKENILSLLRCHFTKKNFGDDVRQRRQWHPTPVLLPGKSHERRSLVGCSPWGC